MGGRLAALTARFRGFAATGTQNVYVRNFRTPELKDSFEMDKLDGTLLRLSSLTQDRVVRPASGSPAAGTSYADGEYWETRYRERPDEATFEWYVGWKELGGLFSAAVPDFDAKVLMVGCGNSCVSEDACRAGYTGIVNVDISGSVIDSMRQRCDNLGLHMEWIEGDVTQLARTARIADCSFDVVFDKGTLDALSCGSRGEDSRKMLMEAHRVLRPGGILVVVTSSSKRHDLTSPVAGVGHRKSAAPWWVIESEHSVISRGGAKYICYEVRKPRPA